MKTLSPEVERIMKYKVVVDAVYDMCDHYDPFEEQERTVTLPDGKKITIRSVHP